MTTEKKSRRIVIACGGTGGHMFPGVAVAERLCALGHRPLLLISRKAVDAEGARKYGELEFRTVQAIAKPRTFSLRMISFLVKFAGSLLSCCKLLRQERADVVLGMGGFTSLAPVMVGRMLGLRTYMHDSNSIPGRANRLTARFCTAVLLGMEEAAKFFPKSDCRVTGTPVRKEVLQAPTQEEARRMLGLPEDTEDDALAEPEGDNQTAASMRVYSFESLDRVSDAARACGDPYDGVNTLYKKPDSRQYFLVVKRDGADDLSFSRACNILSEYGAKIRHEYSSEAYYAEHYEVICRDRAIQIMRQF